jgi:hypothetical protein
MELLSKLLNETRTHSGVFSKKKIIVNVLNNFGSDLTEYLCLPILTEPAHRPI